MSPKDAIKPKLVIIEGKDKGRVIPLRAGITVIGRTKGEVILQDARVSRSHVALNFDAQSGTLTFTDLKSLNGTLVNATQMESGTLSDGDRLQTGNTLFDCQLSDATELAEPVSTPRSRPDRGGGNAVRLEELHSSMHSSINRPEPGFNGEIHPVEADHELGPEPRATQLAEDLGEERSGNRTQTPVGLAARYRKLTASTRRLLIGVALLGVLYLLFTSSKQGPPSSYTHEFNVLKELEKQGKTDQAIQKAEALSLGYAKDPELFITLGELHTQQHHYEPAIQAYRQAKTLNPDHPIATVRLIALYLRSGMGKEAEQEMLNLDRLMKEGKHGRQLFVEAANLFLEFRELTRSPQKALILSRALQNEFATDSTVGYKLEAQLMFQQNLNEEALKVIERGLQRDPQDEWLLENLAFAKLSLKDPAGAVEVVENWIRTHPMASKALLVMAYLKYNEKKYLEALPPLQKIVQIGNQDPGNPHVPEALNLMAQIYMQQGQTAEAKTLFSQACGSGFAQACGHESIQSPQNPPADEVAKP